MEVVLLQPDFDTHTGPLAFEPPPLSLVELSSFLSKLNIESTVFDASFYSVRKFELYLLKQKPAVVGVFIKANSSSSLLEFLGDNSERAYSLVGFGPYCKGREEALLRLGFDFVISGEVEETFLELYSTLKVPMNPFFDHVQGISYQNANGEITYTEERKIEKSVNDYPWINLNTIELERYDTQFFPYSVKHLNYELISEDCKRSSIEITQELNYLSELINGVYLYDLDLTSELALGLLKEFDTHDLKIAFMVSVKTQTDIEFVKHNSIKNACVNYNLITKANHEFLTSLETLDLFIEGEEEFSEVKFYCRTYKVRRVYATDMTYSLQQRIQRVLKKKGKKSFLQRLFGI